MSKSRKDDYSSSSVSVDVEQQLILRLPETAAENLRKDLQSGSSSLKEKLSMEIHPELRKGKVVYDGQMYNAKLYDLPCIVESYKTTDKKTFYKTADVSQILICSNDFDDDSVAEEESSMKKKDKDKKFNWMHGLCRPFKSVRKRRFRKIIPKKNQDQPDTDKELRRLFVTDSQAIEVKYEVIEEDEEPQHGSSNHGKNKSGGTTKNVADSVKASKDPSPRKASFGEVSLDKSPSIVDEALPSADDNGLDDNNHMDIFGDVSSSEDGEDGIADRSLTLEGEEPNDAEFGDNPAEPTEGNSDLVEDNFDSSHL